MDGKSGPVAAKRSDLTSEADDPGCSATQVPARGSVFAPAAFCLAITAPLTMRSVASLIGTPSARKHSTSRPSFGMPYGLEMLDTSSRYRSVRGYRAPRHADHQGLSRATSSDPVSRQRCSRTDARRRDPTPGSTPARSLPMMASSDDSTIAARKRLASLSGSN